MQLDTRDTIAYLLDEGMFDSYSGIARYVRENSSSKLQPIQVSKYHRGLMTMGEKTAEAFLKLFKIEVLGAHRAKGRPDEWGE